MKRPKHDDDDIISRLPEELLTHILSLLPDKDANRTRILSNRWNHLCAILPNLHFDMPIDRSFDEINKFHDFVDRTVALRGHIPIQRFTLKFTLPPWGHILNYYVPTAYHMKCDYNRVYDWLCTVVTCKVQEIELTFPPDRYKVMFCWDLFKTCNTLVDLTLEGQFVLDVPLESELLFPCLKKINLLSVVFSGDQSLTNLISGCPVLQELLVERRMLKDKLHTFKVSLPSLKRLRIKWYMLDDGEALIDAPNLEYLYIEDSRRTNYSFSDMSSLVEAYISHFESIVQLVPCVSSVKILTLTHQSVSALSNELHAFDMPMFPNLVKLVIGRTWNHLRNFLINMPNLEHLTFSDGLLPFKEKWNPPVDAPACLRFSMKVITILNWQSVKQKEITLIRYLLKHSNNLEKLTIKSPEIILKRREQLLKIRRCSKSCWIEFL